MKMFTEQVIDIAMEFMKNKANFPWPRLEGITPIEETDKEKSFWEVLINVELTEKQIKRVVIDNKDGNVIQYNDG